VGRCEEPTSIALSSTYSGIGLQELGELVLGGWCAPEAAAVQARVYGCYRLAQQTWK